MSSALVHKAHVICKDISIVLAKMTFVLWCLGLVVLNVHTTVNKGTNVFCMHQMYNYLFYSFMV